MIYFDNNATTPIAPEAFEAMKPFLQNSYGNPSSAYGLGRSAKRAVEIAREQVAQLLGASETNEIIFTSGGTESDNCAVLGALRANPDKRHIVTTRVEHEAVRKLCEKLATENFEITWLDVDRDGNLDTDALKKSLRRDTAVVSVMTANNETGVLFPIEEIARIVKEHSDALFHSDGVNAAGKIPLNLKNTETDLFSVSGHKFYAPKGIGALYVRKAVNFPSFLIGGGQEKGLRAGTEAVHQIVALGAAAELCQNTPATENIRNLRDKLERFILQNIPDIKLNGTSDNAKRLPNTSNISFSKTNGEAILAKLDDAGICVSTGSACHAAAHTASVVLQAMEIPYADAMGTIRFSLGRYNTNAEVDFVIEKLPQIIEDVRATGFQN